MLDIVTVNYHGCKSTESFLKTIDFSRVGRVVVVDNSNCDKEINRLEGVVKSFSEAEGKVFIVDSGSNLGYMGGCNKGLEFIRSKGGSSDNVIFCNNDIEFSDSFFSSLAGILDRDEYLGSVIVPNVVDTHTEKELNPFLLVRPKKTVIDKLRKIYSNFFIAYLFHTLSVFKSYIFKKKKPSNFIPRKVYASHGSIFILPVKLIREGVDDGYFMYGEEVTVAEAARVCGIESWYFPNLLVKHVSHATTGAFLSYRTFSWKRAAINYIGEKYEWD